MGKGKLAANCGLGILQDAKNLTKELGAKVGKGLAKAKQIAENTKEKIPDYIGAAKNKIPDMMKSKGIDNYYNNIMTAKSINTTKGSDVNPLLKGSSTQKILDRSKVNRVKTPKFKEQTSPKEQMGMVWDKIKNAPIKQKIVGGVVGATIIGGPMVYGDDSPELYGSNVRKY